MNNPESRRAMRSIAQVVVVAVFVGVVAWQVYLLRTQADDEFHLAMILLAIVGLFVALVGAENVGRVMVEFGIAKAQIGGDDPPQGGGNGQ